MRCDQRRDAAQPCRATRNAGCGEALSGRARSPPTPGATRPRTTHFHSRPHRQLLAPAQLEQSEPAGCRALGSRSHPTIRAGACIGNEHEEDSRHLPVGDRNPRCTGNAWGDPQAPVSGPAPGVTLARWALLSGPPGAQPGPRIASNLLVLQTSERWWMDLMLTSFRDSFPGCKSHRLLEGSGGKMERSQEN